MITATYFGEITELDSRAVWYSDEDDEDDDILEDHLEPSSPSKVNPIKPASHETIRSNISLNFRRILSNPNVQFSNCIISQSSSAQFKNIKLNDQNSHILLGYFNEIGKAFACPIVKDQQLSGQYPNEFVLWLLFDSSGQYISGEQVGYLVEILRELLYKEFNLDHSSQILILSQQFSGSEHLEYLSNYNTLNPMIKLPFQGRPILPPSLIRNYFESALFEQLTITLKPALVICLPNPKNFWFDKTRGWPSVPDKIIECKLNDDNLDKTLIFT